MQVIKVTTIPDRVQCIVLNVIIYGWCVSEWNKTKVKPKDAFSFTRIRRDMKTNRSGKDLTVNDNELRRRGV